MNIAEIELTEDEKQQVAEIEKIAKKTRTYKLRKGYKKLKRSNKRQDVIACNVVKLELNSRGKL